MTPDFEPLSEPQEYELAQRAEEILEECFAGSVNEAQAGELLEIWQRLPKTREAAKEQAFIESVFRLSRRQPTSLSEEQLRQFDALCRERFGVSRQTGEHDSVDSLDFDELIQLAATSKSVERPRPSIETPRKAESPQPERAAVKPSRQVQPMILIAVCVSLFTIGVYWEFFHPSASTSGGKSFRPIAQVDSVLDVQWGEQGTPLKEGRYLERGLIRFESGIVQLTLNNGVRVAIHGPADFRLNAPKQVFCGKGELSVSVSPGAKGFEVVTPLLNVVDLGTEFHLDIQDERIEAQTIAGKIELRHQEQKKIDVSAGQAILFDDSGEAKPFTADPARFLSALFVRSQKEVRDEEQLDFWKDARQRLRDMPGLRCFLDFEADGETGRVRGAKHCEGRWKHKSAYSFINKNDRIDFDLSGNADSITLFASLRFETLDRSSRTLFADQSGDAGSLLWQVRSDGSVQLAVFTSPEDPPIQYRTRPVFGPETLGAWYQLAVAIDADKQEVRTWLDGELLDTSPIRDPRRLKLGASTLGNRPIKRTMTDSSLGGRIDQFMIFDRPLGAEELKTLSSAYSKHDP